MSRKTPAPHAQRGLSPEEHEALERSSREAEAKVALLKLGVSRSQIMELVERYSLERIEKQLQWLPLRRPRKPSSLIVSAIKENYEAPAAALEQAAENSSSSDYREAPHSPRPDEQV